jgi:hypothetical protein
LDLMHTVFLTPDSRNLRFENRRVLHRVQMPPAASSMIVSSTHGLAHRAAQPPP